ncbi:endonuclease/exonuclease/phosphatase family protein [Jatrophihabitans telluris]|uniref:Endonuclease/exonuclease/phosphatase family protein n=1 Tax=Jatrophihabitans telluris TaxID=2038343 RepID=A0ABY4QVK3_9ACTN|nr:endonuclease/exonuclease/phosphatase family protein [Jatrophihabitans telluris]UQX87520.1 endonuclease/exonuclease/phosphatase family protein [Jatrophihabitans telluris]
MTTLRLLVYNIRSLRDDADAVMRVIKSAEPNVVAIQEAPRFLRWRATAAGIARRSGLVVVGGGRPAAANLLLCGLEVEVEHQADVLFSKDRKLHQRGSAIAAMRLSGAPFAVAGIHLDLAAEPRLRHVRELHQAIDREVPPDFPIIVAGDTNDDPGSRVWQALQTRGVDAWASAGTGDGITSSVAVPRRRIDAAFVDPRLTVSGVSVLNTPDVRIASDHRPLLIEISLSQ